MTDPWDGRPPEEWREKCAWHWFETPHGDRIPILWNYTRWEKNALPNLRTEDCWQAHECRYLAPCLSPDEIAVLRERAERAELQRDACMAGGYAARQELAQVQAALRTARAAALREAAKKWRIVAAIEEALDADGEPLSWAPAGLETRDSVKAAMAESISAAIRALIEKEKPDA